MSKANRARNGNGSIVKLDRNRYQVYISTGRDPVTGKYGRKTKIVNGSMKDAQKVLDEMTAELKSGLKVDADKMTLIQFCNEYLEAKETAGNASTRTIEENRRKIKLIGEIVGNAPLKSFDARAIERLYSEIRKRRIGHGYNCGNTTLRGYHTLLKAIFRKAVDYDYILRNPCDKVEAPKVDDVNRRSLETPDASRLLKILNTCEVEAIRDLNEKEARQIAWGVDVERDSLRGLSTVAYLMAVRLGLATGMRLGEVLGLEWGNVNLVTCSIRVTQSLDRNRNPKPPKSKAGIRTVSVDVETVRHLAAWKELQIRLFESLFVEVTDNFPVICTGTASFVGQNNFERWWREWRSSNGFEGLKFHELRHTQATQLLANGVDIKTVQSRLGHANASLTLNTYAHALPQNDKKAAELIGGLFQASEESEPVITVSKSA